MSKNKFRFSRKMLAIPYGMFLMLFVIVPLILVVYFAFTDIDGHFTFDNVIAVSNDGLKAGEDVKDASVTASVVENGKAKKVIVYKYKRKTGYHKKNGHRQQYTKVKIEKING